MLTIYLGIHIQYLIKDWRQRTLLYKIKQIKIKIKQIIFSRIIENCFEYDFFKDRSELSRLIIVQT